MHGDIRQDTSRVHRNIIDDRSITKSDACEACRFAVALPDDVQAHCGVRAASVASKLDHGFGDTVALPEAREPGAAVAVDVSVGKNRTHHALPAITLPASVLRQKSNG